MTPLKQTPVISAPDSNLKSYEREYSNMLRSVLALHDLRFRIVTAYLIGTFTSLSLALLVSPFFGFSIAFFITVLMFLLDLTLHDRQALFSYQAAKLELKIYFLRGDRALDNHIEDGFFIKYFNDCWGHKCKPKISAIETLKIKLNNIRKRLNDWVQHKNKKENSLDLDAAMALKRKRFLRTRGIIYLVIFIFLSILCLLTIFRIVDFNQNLITSILDK